MKKISDDIRINLPASNNSALDMIDALFNSFLEKISSTGISSISKSFNHLRIYLTQTPIENVFSTLKELGISDDTSKHIEDNSARIVLLKQQVDDLKRQIDNIQHNRQEQELKIKELEEALETLSEKYSDLTFEQRRNNSAYQEELAKIQEQFAAEDLKLKTVISSWREINRQTIHDIEEKMRRGYRDIEVAAQRKNEALIDEIERLELKIKELVEKKEEVRQNKEESDTNGAAIIDDYEIVAPDDENVFVSEVSEEERCIILCQIAWDCYQSKQYEEAYKNWCKASELGSAVAKYNIGWCYENACYVTYNLEKAIGYYVAADALGNEEAKKALERIRIKREQEQAKIENELAEQRRETEEARRAKIAADIQRQQAEENARKAKEEAKLRVKEAVRTVGPDDSQRFTQEQLNGITQGRGKIVEKVLRGGPVQNITQQPADYPTLQNYDKSEFVISGTSLKKYCGKGGIVRIPIGVTDIGHFDLFSEYHDILDHAFYNCKNIIHVEIPNTVVRIGVYEFHNCSGLKTITISNSVKRIGMHAFSFCSSLTEIRIPNSVADIGYCAFTHCDNLRNITVDNENGIYKSTNDCLINTERKELILGCKNSIIPRNNTVTKICGYAFYGCRGLTSLEIPENVKSIGDNAFNDCSALVDIVLSDNGWGICSGCSSLKTVTLLKSVKNISREMFCHCDNLTQIVIPSGVNSIMESAFSNCANLNSVDIPGTVIKIDKYAFYGCKSLSTINFRGTKAQWKKIEKGDNWNTYAGRYTVYCEDGNLPKWRT